MQSITVKIPARWKVDSARAQIWLRDYFVNPVALPSDNFAAEKAVCLSLNGRQADALARGLGEPRAVALRRLLAVHVQELPPASSGEIVHVSKRERPKVVKRGANSDSAYIAGQSATGEIGGRQFVDITDDAAVPVPVSESLPVQSDEMVPAVQRPSVLKTFFEIVLWIVPITFLLTLIGSSGESSASGDAAAFPEWRPK